MVPLVTHVDVSSGETTLVAHRALCASGYSSGRGGTGGRGEGG